MSFAFATTHHFHNYNSFHHGGSWYITLPVLAVVIGVAIWRRRRRGGGRGLFGGPGDQ